MKTWTIKKSSGEAKELNAPIDQLLASFLVFVAPCKRNYDLFSLNISLDFLSLSLSFFLEPTCVTHLFFIHLLFRCQLFLLFLRLCQKSNSSWLLQPAQSISPCSFSSRSLLLSSFDFFSPLHIPMDLLLVPLSYIFQLLCSYHSPAGDSVAIILATVMTQKLKWRSFCALSYRVEMIAKQRRSPIRVFYAEDDCI